MSVKHAILGLLCQKPMHGYELKNAFDETFGPLWDLNFGQIYTTLERLEKDDFVNQDKVVVQFDRPDKKIYSITKKGQSEFKGWLKRPIKKIRGLKDEFFIKLLFSEELSSGETLNLINEQRKLYFKLMADLTRIKTELDQKERARTILLLDAGILHTEADLKWLDICEEEIKRRKKDV